MKLLLDTQVLFWAAAQPHRLSASARELIADPNNDLLFSAVSLLEIAMKQRTGRADFRTDPRLLRRGLLDNGYTELAITGAHALAVESLPPLHSDPFDRILIAQANAQGALLITTDDLVAQYPGPVQKI